MTASTSEGAEDALMIMQLFFSNLNVNQSGSLECDSTGQLTLAPSIVLDAVSDSKPFEGDVGTISIELNY